VIRSDTVRLRLDAAGAATERPISVAIVAMGGQGGGVLTGWIVKLAEGAGWVAQSTSIPGVAQRTGATIYYVEMMQAQGGRVPVLAQMPTPGDVDVVIASEFIEAGRSILRGIVTPDRTTLIASTHRSFAIGEKSAPGKGLADGRAVAEAIGTTARYSILFDMDALATAHSSVISSAMFGALAGAEVLPFPPDAYRAVIRGESKGVAASISAFDAAYAKAIGTADDADAEPAPIRAPSDRRIGAPSSGRAESLLQRLNNAMPLQATAMARAGLTKIIDYQDLDYGSEYLDALEKVHWLDREIGGHERDYALTLNAAKYLANAMTYDDVVRVADLKTRAARHQRIGNEIGLRPGQLFETTEYMHPRMEELVGLVPARLGRWLKGQHRLYAWLDRRISKGRRVRTYSPGWFLLLYGVAGLRRLRRASLRHAEESARRRDWLELVFELAPRNYALGVEVLKCQRLIKGYSDTHEGGVSKFGKVTAEIARIADRDDAATWAQRLRNAAIRDGEGADLDGLIRTLRSFA